MQKGKMVAAIDVGTDKVTTIIASESPEHKKINVMGVASTASKGIRKGQIVDIEEATEAITESVEAAERMAGYSITQAVVSIGGAHIASQNSKGVVAEAEPEGEITDANGTVYARAGGFLGPMGLRYYYPGARPVDAGLRCEAP